MPGRTPSTWTRTRTRLGVGHLLTDIDEELKDLKPAQHPQIAIRVLARPRPTCSLVGTVCSQRGATSMGPDVDVSTKATTENPNALQVKI